MHQCTINNPLLLCRVLPIRPSVRPSACLSVTYGLPTRKQKGVEKRKLMWTFTVTLSGPASGLPIFSSICQRSGLRLRLRSAVDEYM